MILTINYIIDRFKDYADKHANINDFVFGNFQDSENRQYPLLNVRLEAPSYIVQGDRSLTPQVSLTFRIIDRIITIENDENGYRSTNETEIYSDNYQYMIDTLHYIKSTLSPELGLNVRNEDLVTLDPIEQTNEDDTCGWEADMLFTTKYLNCDIPGISGGSSPNTIPTISNNYITCATLGTCQTIIDIENTLSNIVNNNDYTTTATLNGNVIEFDRTDTQNAYSVDLTPIINGGGSSFTCADLPSCQTIIDIETSISTNQTDITNLQTDVSTNQTDITNIQSQVNSLPTSNDYTNTATLNGNVIEFDRTDTLNAYSVDLTSIIGGPDQYVNSTFLLSSFNPTFGNNYRKTLRLVRFDTFGGSVNMDLDLADLETTIDIQTQNLANDNQTDISNLQNDVSTNANDMRTYDILNISSDYTLQDTDNFKLIIVDSTSPVTITVDGIGFSGVGRFTELLRNGTGSVTIQGINGALIKSPSGSTPSLTSQYSACTIVETSSSSFNIIGDVS